jgi:hypothetical protein
VYRFITEFLSWSLFLCSDYKNSRGSLTPFGPDRPNGAKDGGAFIKRIPENRR